MNHWTPCTDQTTACADKMISITSQQQFDEIIKEHQFVICYFYDEDCEPCESARPIVENLAEVYSQQATFCKVNAPVITLATSVIVWGYPTFLLFQKGECVLKLTGSKLIELEEKLQEIKTGLFQKDEGYFSWFLKTYSY